MGWHGLRQNCQQRAIDHRVGWVGRYPGLFFKAHRPLHYELLNGVRVHGDWERWLDVFAEAVAVSAAQAVQTAQDLLALVGADSERLATLGRATPSAWALHGALQRQPVAAAATRRATSAHRPSATISIWPPAAPATRDSA